MHTVFFAKIYIYFRIVPQKVLQECYIYDLCSNSGIRNPHTGVLHGELIVLSDYKFTGGYMKLILLFVTALRANAFLVQGNTTKRAAVNAGM